MTTDARVLRADRFAEIGGLVERDAGLIIDRWCRRVVQDQSTAQFVHREVLRDHLPQFLAELASGLRESGDPYQRPHCAPAVQHGEQRWQTGWSLREVVRDYQVLRLVLLDYLDESLDRTLELREVLAIGLALDEAIEASVVRYVQFREEQSAHDAQALRAADTRKNEFLATLAHELRNPLAALRNTLEVLRLSPAVPPEEHRSLREIMDRQTAQMTRLVEDLLDASRIALGKFELRRTHLDLRGVLRNAAQTAKPLLERREQRLEQVLGDCPLWVDGDEARLLQVFTNLLSNASRYSPRGTPVALNAEAQGNQAVVRVTDRGVGIPPDMLTRIFDPFIQVDHHRPGPEGGLGIGLSLVRDLVRLHGGAVEASSLGVGQGSEFRVVLPLVAAAAPPERAAVAPPGGARRILLVEDNADARRSLELLLKLIGHRVIAVGDGASGLEAARQEPPEVALVDIGLPDMDGYQVAEALRRILGSQVLLVALTGHSQPEDRQRAMDAGFDTHLVKPVDLATLQPVLAAREAQTPA